MTDIEELIQTIKRLHGVESKHVGSVAVKESFQGQVIWDGTVEVFDLIDHPQAKIAYAWKHKTDDPNHPERQVTVLELPPVNSPATAVRAVIAKDFRDNEKKR